MLQEDRFVIQTENEPRKRIFSDDCLQLITWDGDSGRPVHFQLAYEISAKPRVVEWRSGALYHYELNSGPSDFTQMDRSALLKPNRTLDRELVSSLFKAASAKLPVEIRIAVLNALL